MHLPALLLGAAAGLTLVAILLPWYEVRVSGVAESGFLGGFSFSTPYEEDRQTGPFRPGGDVLGQPLATYVGLMAFLALVLLVWATFAAIRARAEKRRGGAAFAIGLAAVVLLALTIYVVPVFSDPEFLVCPEDDCRRDAVLLPGWVLALASVAAGLSGSITALGSASRVGRLGATTTRSRARSAGARTAWAGAFVLAPGSHFLGKYRIEKELGRGAFGSTWLAEHEKLKRKAVIKQLHPEWSAVPEARERFQREAHILAAMDHDHVTRVYDCEEVSGSWYLVMEYIDGGSLEEKMKKGPLSAQDAVRVTAEILEGLDYIHEQSILHRDVKPSNILLTRKGGVKIADFGVARSGGTAPGLTMPGSAPGTPIYMAPEQLRGQQGDERSDLFAVGALFYHLVTGGHHFGNTPRDEFELRRRVLEEPPRLPIPEMRESLNAWLERSLEKKPADRYPSAYAMREALLLAAPPNA